MTRRRRPPGTNIPIPDATNATDSPDAPDATLAPVASNTPNSRDALPPALFDVAAAAQRRAVRNRARRATRSARMANAIPADSLPRRTPRQQLGDTGEERAWRVLEAAGCQLLARQLRCPLGELDLVVRDRGQLVFVEVRVRNDTRFGSAADSIGRDKQQRIVRAARWWLRALTRLHFSGRTPPCRFDVVTIDRDSIRWHADAMRPGPD